MAKRQAQKNDDIMMNERALFDAAMEIEDPIKRRAFVEKACADDQGLLQRIMSLLESHEKANSFLETPAIGLNPQDVDKTPHGSDIDRTSDFSIGHSDEVLASSKTKVIENDDGSEDLVDISFLSPSTKPGSIGSLGHYEILQVLGQGGFGIVFKAFDEKLHRLVAIKVMNPQLASTSPPRKRFLREARSVAAIKNENVVQVYSVEEQPLPYMVMEFVDGKTLQAKLDGNGPLDVNEVLYLGRQMANALASAHALGIIHRDIKPGNILIDQGAEQKVKITDFGLARTVDDASMTRTGLISGTPMYMAPEQALGLTLDHRTDLFSLGSVLYQMACGRPAFRASTTVAVLRRVAEDTPRAMREIVPELPEWLVAIINKLMAKNPEDRFQSAKEVSELFERCGAQLQASGNVTGVEASLDMALREPNSVTKQVSNQIKDSVATEKRSLARILFGMLLGILVLLPILFGKQLSSYMNTWIWPAIPVLPETAVAGGLEFDGKDDFVSIDAVDWSYPQFTIEAFVTSASDSDNGTIVQLGSGGDKPEWMSLYDDRPADPGKRLSGAAIQGKTPFANTSAPLTAGVRQHRALVFDGRYMHYYVNGIWQAKRFAEAHEGLMWKMKNLRIACDGSERRFFQGRIDQIRISRVARYKDNFAPITSVISDGSTLALYNFDEGTGEVLKDASGNGHDGKIVGAKWLKPTRTDSQRESPERALAEWVFQQEKPIVWIDDSPIQITRVEDLPDRPYYVAGFVANVFPDSFGDRELRKISEVSRLETIMLRPVQGGIFDQITDLGFQEIANSSFAPRLKTLDLFLNCPKVTSAAIGSFNSFAELESLNIESSQINSDALLSLHLPNLRHLGLNRVRISQSFVSSIPAQFPNLTSLGLVGMDLGNTDIASLAPLAIDQLDLSWSKLRTSDPASLKNLSKLPNLKVLNLISSEISDNGLESLIAIKTLERLSLEECKNVTEAGVRKLQTALPKCEILSSFSVTATGWHGWPSDAPPPAIAPFDAEHAKQHQEAWANYLKVPVEYTNSIGMKFRLIPPGEFMMGAPQDEIEEMVAKNVPQNKVWEDVIRSQGPQHRVILTQPFYAGIHEVTQGQFQRVNGRQNQSSIQPESTQETNESRNVNHPVRTATWGDAINFTVQLSQLEQIPASYLAIDERWIPQNSSGYQLPTEAQWEFAGRAGTTTRYWSGPAINDLLAVDWVAENSENRTHAVGEKPANPFGLFDVHGNEIEWTENEFDPTDYQKSQQTPSIDPRKLKNQGWTTFVARGGRSDNWGVQACSSAFRLPRAFGNPTTKSDIGGCRLVLSVEAVRMLSKLTGPSLE